MTIIERLRREAADCECTRSAPLLNAAAEQIEQLERQLQEARVIIGNQHRQLGDLRASRDRAGR